MPRVTYVGLDLSNDIRMAQARYGDAQHFYACDVGELATHPRTLRLILPAAIDQWTAKYAPQKHTLRYHDRASAR